MANKIKSYTEAELYEMFGLTRLLGNTAHSIMQTWTGTTTTLTSAEQELFDEIHTDAVQHIMGWQEEDLKMLFIAFVLKLGYLRNTKKYNNFFEKTIDATVDGYYLKTKTDYMIARGVLDTPKHPYFHFQEWKPSKRPTGDSMAQLLEAFLIAQQKNNNGKPIYGCEVTGRYWNFVILKDRTYCVSDAYDCTKKADLMQIIAILRKFKYILDTELIDK